MGTETSYQLRRQIMIGLLLVGVGTLFFLDRINVLEVDQVWHYWPLLLVAFGANKMIDYASAKHFVSGLGTLLTGLWLFAVFEHMWGLTFRNSWPFLFIVWGGQLIIEPLLAARLKSDTEHGNEK